jgi:hypothetical protein
MWSRGDPPESESNVNKYRVELTTEQRKELLHLISTGKAAARELTHARNRPLRMNGPEYMSHP